MGRLRFNEGRFKMHFRPVEVGIGDGFRAWNAQVGHYSFCITYEPIRYDGEDKKYSGYTASWKNTEFDTRPALPSFGGIQPANRIDGGPWEKFSEAAAACNNMWKQLRQQQ